MSGITLVTFLTLTGCASQGSSARPASTPSASTHVLSAVEKPTLTGRALTDAFTIPGNLQGDDLAKTFVQKIQDWGQYGENLATQEGGVNVLKAQSQTGGETIAEALITSENIDSPLMSQFKNDMIAQNISIADAWSKTFNKDPSSNAYPYVDKEAFNQTLEFKGATVVSTDDATGEVTMDINFVQHTDLKNRLDPTQESTINPDDAGFARDNVNAVWRVIFVHENGATKAKSVIVEPH